MENWADRWFWPVLHTILLGAMLSLVLLQTYGLYLAVAVMPRDDWRRRLAYRLHRALFALDQLRLGART